MKLPFRELINILHCVFSGVVLAILNHTRIATNGEMLYAFHIKLFVTVVTLTGSKEEKIKALFFFA